MRTLEETFSGLSETGDEVAFWELGQLAKGVDAPGGEAVLVVF